jgi:importin subunit alpha-1
MANRIPKDRKNQYKKAIVGDDSRRRREEAADDLRKQKREEEQAARRKKGDTFENPFGGITPNMASAESPRAELINPERMQALVVGVMSDDPNVQLECVTHFRKLLSIERNPPIRDVIDTGVVPRLVHFLTFHHNPQLQFEAAWALTNIASGTSADTKVVIDVGAHKLFVQLLQSPNAEVAEQAVWALGNIAGDSTQYRDLVLLSGALKPLLALCVPSAKISMLRNATWTLSNLCRGKPQPSFELVQAALPVLANLLNCRDDEVLTDACWALSYLSDDTGPNNQKIQAVIASGVAKRLVELLMHRSPNVKTPALRTVGNIVTGDDLQTQVIIQSSALPALLALLNHPKKGIRKETCWTISNITAGNADQIQAVIEANIIPPLVTILKTSDFEIKKEAAWAISNATSGGTEPQVRHLVEQGVVAPLCDLFTCPDPKIIMVALEGIENILKIGARIALATHAENKYADYVELCGGTEKLVQLQHHTNMEIYNKAAHILQEYFDGEATEEPAFTPETNVTGESFTFNPNGGGGYRY